MNVTVRSLWVSPAATGSETRDWVANALDLLAAEATRSTDTRLIPLYLRWTRRQTRLCVVDPPGSAFLDAWAQRPGAAAGTGSVIEGIGRPTREESFLSSLVDAMLRVPDEASVAALRLLESLLVGGWATQPART
ncbi:hypothetical protein V6U90_30870 [Micromonospora sp. CPCC 206060]|uniref:hypothetical protein n=1 Tax=Micromonospora sp. CPCC 206060 TaxID=3122406 RepID=UPI002FF3B8E3